MTGTTEAVSGRQMCEAIASAGFLRKADGTAPTPEEIWESSPSGELFQVFEWYDLAKKIIAARATRGRK